MGLGFDLLFRGVLLLLFVFLFLLWVCCFVLFDVLGGLVGVGVLGVLVGEMRLGVGFVLFGFLIGCWLLVCLCLFCLLGIGWFSYWLMFCCLLIEWVVWLFVVLFVCYGCG